jgi:hypothetical protein
MKKIVIFRDSFATGKRVRTILRAVRPDPTFVGYYKNGSLNDQEVKKLASYLEPGYSGYYIA